MGKFTAKDYSVEYDASRYDIEVVAAFTDLILVVLRVRKEHRSE